MTDEHQGFGRQYRLTKKGEFEEIFSRRQVIRSQGMDVYFDTGAQGTRQAGFIVSRKTAHKATERNRIKRRLREIFRKNRILLPEGTRIIFRPRAEIKDYDYWQLEALFAQLADRIKQRIEQKRGL